MAARVYYRRVRLTGVWHILHSDDWKPRDPLALCGENCTDSTEGYAPAYGNRVHDPPGTCEACKLLADGARQLALDVG